MYQEMAALNSGVGVAVPLIPLPLRILEVGVKIRAVEGPLLRVKSGEDAFDSGGALQPARRAKTGGDRRSFASEVHAAEIQIGHDLELPL